MATKHRQQCLIPLVINGMQNKTTVRHYYKSDCVMATMKNYCQDQRLVRMRRYGTIHTQLVGMQNGTATLKNSVVAFFKNKILNIYQTFNSATALLSIYPKAMKIYVQTKNLYINACSIFASPKLEIIYKQTVEHPHQQEKRNELLVSTALMNLKKIMLTKKKKKKPI